MPPDKCHSASFQAMPGATEYGTSPTTADHDRLSIAAKRDRGGNTNPILVTDLHQPTL